RHEGRHGRLRPRDRARLRYEDRRGDAARDPAGPAGDRGVPRQGRSRGARGVGVSAAAVPAPVPAPVAAPGTILEVDSIDAFYGSIQARRGVSLEVRDGEIVTLIGANGAGKSTTLRAINGIVHPRNGRIRFEGEDITRQGPHDIVKRGISQSPEGRRLFPRMTV